MGSSRVISRICFGCEPLGGMDWGKIDVADIASAISRALEFGVNFFDTADVYGLGMSESRLSEILGHKRHEVVIATKGGMSWDDTQISGRAKITKDCSPKYLRCAVEASLRRLRIDSIPVYFIHWPDPNTEIGSTIECLSRLRDEGKIGQIGCSNFDSAMVRSASEISEISFIQLPINLLDKDLDPVIQGIAIEKNIGIVAYNVLARGLLTGNYDANCRFPQNDRRARLPLFHGEAYRNALTKVADISTAATADNLTCAQYAISKVLDLPGVVSVILGIKNRLQIEENCTILSTR